jgi:putative acetyltransferase
MPVLIRPESPTDAPAIFAVTEAAFRTAAHSAGTEQFIVDALRRAGVLAVSLVAELGGSVIGHVAVSPVTVSDGAPGWYGLGPISVLPQHQRAGVGSQLMVAALQALRDRGAASFHAGFAATA